jgi:hypothetical protein
MATTGLQDRDHKVEIGNVGSSQVEIIEVCKFEDLQP